MFYVILILAATALPFILGRVIVIFTRLEHQLKTYTEAAIWGDLSESDIAAAGAQFGGFVASLPLFSWCKHGEPYLAEHRVLWALGP